MFTRRSQGAAESPSRTWPSCGDDLTARLRPGQRVFVARRWGARESVPRRVRDHVVVQAPLSARPSLVVGRPQHPDGRTGACPAVVDPARPRHARLSAFAARAHPVRPAPRYQTAGVRWSSMRPGRGPWPARRRLESAGDAAGLYLGVDLPLVTAALLTMLAAMQSPRRGVPVTPGGPSPVRGCTARCAGSRSARGCGRRAQMTSFGPTFVCGRRSAAWAWLRSVSAADLPNVTPRGLRGWPATRRAAYHARPARVRHGPTRSLHGRPWLGMLWGAGCSSGVVGQSSC